MKELTTKVTKDKYIIQYETDDETEYYCLQETIRAYIDGMERTYFKNRFQRYQETIEAAYKENLDAMDDLKMRIDELEKERKETDDR